jgi:arylsulfatase A-like enzyme
VIVMAGGPIAPGTHIDDASVYDIAPSVLHLMGLAVGEDMDGRVLPEVMQAPGHSPRPVKTVASWETGAPERPVDPIRTEHDDAIVRRLRALGYLDESEEPAGP